MAGEKSSLNSVNELNVDNYFSGGSAAPEEDLEQEDDAVADQVDEESKASEKKKKSEKDLYDDEEDDEDLDDDLEDDEDDDDEEDDSDDSKSLKALRKKAKNAEEQRAEMQSKYDRLLSQFNQINNNYTDLRNEIEDLKNQAEYQDDNSAILEGSDDELLTKGEARKFARSINRRKPEKKAAIGTDLEAQQMWATSQADANVVNEYVTKNNLGSDPEIQNLRTFEGRYLHVRNKIAIDEMTRLRRENKGLKKKIKKMGKGTVPKTGASNRSGSPTRKTNRTERNDPLSNFFKSW